MIKTYVVQGPMAGAVGRCCDWPGKGHADEWNWRLVAICGWGLTTALVVRGLFQTWAVRAHRSRSRTWHAVCGAEVGRRGLDAHRGLQAHPCAVCGVFMRPSIVYGAGVDVAGPFVSGNRQRVAAHTSISAAFFGVDVSGPEDRRGGQACAVAFGLNDGRSKWALGARVRAWQER